MRVMDLYDLKNRKKKRNKIKESLIQDIESVAECMFDSEFEKFGVEFRLKKINRYK